MARIFILSGDQLGQTYDIDGPVTLGRGKEAGLLVRGASVSRLHARLDWDDRGRWILSDLGSSNGTRVDGRRLQGAHGLRDGDVFYLGEVELRLRTDGEVGRGIDTASAEGFEETASGRIEDPSPPGNTGVRLTTAPSRESAEFELEGEWDEQAVISHRPIHGHPVKRPVDSQDAADRVDPAGTAQRARAAQRAEALGGTPSRPTGTTASGGKVLQYQKRENRGGLLSTDISQQPLLVRWLLYILLVGACGGMVWAAYHLTTSVRRTDATLDQV